MVNKIIELKVLQSYNPFERFEKLESPLNKKLEGHGGVIGGSSVIKVSKEGIREISYCSLDISLANFEKGLQVIREYLESNDLSRGAEVKYIDEKNEQVSINFTNLS